MKLFHKNKKKRVQINLPDGLFYPISDGDQDFELAPSY